MTNQRNRGTGTAPTPAEVKQARGNLTQAKAAALIHTDGRRWRSYESGESRMHPAMWELFLIKSSLK